MHAVMHALIWSLGLALLACKGDTRQPGAESPKPAKPSVRLLAMTDLSGYLEPCGCQSRPLGGIDKAAKLMKDLSSDGVPAVWVSAGDLFFEPETGAHGATERVTDDAAKTEQLWRAETLADALKRLALVAATGGSADLRYGADSLAALDARAGKPLLSGTRVIERAGTRLGIWSERESAGDKPAPDLLALAAKHTTELRAQGAHVVIGLVHADARIARRIAGATRGLDFLLVAGARLKEVVPPERVGTTTLLHAGRDGQGLLVVDLFRSGEGAFQDVSEWTQAASRRALAERVADLDAKVAAWRKDPSTDPALLAEQEKRLHRLRAEQSQSAAASARANAHSNAFAARYVELDPEVKNDAELRALLDAHDKRVNAHNRVALAHLVAPPVPAGSPGYVGSDRCAECHESEHQWWRGHPHGRAYETLVSRDKQFSLSCVGCHVTGYGQPGGATVTHNEGLIDVGCESCHGPASIHIEDPDADEDKNVHRDAPETACAQCHTPEHSDLFDYAKYKQKLIVPGHGLPLANNAPSAAPTVGAHE